MKKISSNRSRLTRSHLVTLVLISLVTSIALPLHAQESTAPDKAQTPNQPEKKPGNPDNSSASTTKQPMRPPPSAQRATSPSGSQANMKELAKSFSSDAANWLSTDRGEFFALWQADRSGEGKGAMLIVHAEGEHPAWPQTTQPLHDSLPDYGWATLAISLPPAISPEIPTRTLPQKTQRSPEQSDEATTEAGQKPTDDSRDPSNAEEASNTTQTPAVTAPKTPPVPAENISEERITAALKFLHDKGQFNVAIMGSGIGAIRAHRFIEAVTPKVSEQQFGRNIEKPIRALLLFNARNRLPMMEKDYQQWFSDPDMPIVDIFTTADIRNPKEARQRAVLAKQKNAKRYKQIKSAPITQETVWGENRLSRRIRSFLETSVKGVEVDNAKIRKNN